LEAIIVEAYLRCKTAVCDELLREGILFSGIDWKTSSSPSGTHRPIYK
jgi:hypothetical protein